MNSPNRTFHFNLIAASALFTAGLGSARALGQDSLLFHRGVPPNLQRPASVENASLIFKAPLPPKVLEEHDIVTVVVSINTRALSEGDAEARKTASLDAVLANWVILDGLRKVTPDPQTAGSPRVTGQLNSQFRADSEVETRNTLTFTIAAEVLDIRPNGTLVIEARRTVEVNDQVWVRALTGIIRREDVTPDNKVLSEDIVDLRIRTYETGQVRDGYRRGWLHTWYERFMPF